MWIEFERMDQLRVTIVTCKWSANKYLPYEYLHLHSHYNFSKVLICLNVTLFC